MTKSEMVSRCTHLIEKLSAKLEVDPSPGLLYIHRELEALLRELSFGYGGQCSEGTSDAIDGIETILNKTRSAAQIEAFRQELEGGLTGTLLLQFYGELVACAKERGVFDET